MTIANPDPAATVGPKRHRPRRAAAIGRLDDLERRSNLTRRQLLTWVGHKLRPTAPIYNLAVTLAIDGVVDVARFGRAFQTLLDSSDALRTVIEDDDGVPRQRVVPPFAYEMGLCDLSAHADPDAGLRAWVAARVAQPFDLAGRLFDVTLVKLAAAKFVCVLVQDHIVTDGWSIWLTFQHLATLYEQALEDRLPLTIALPQYGAWVEHERAYRASARHARDAEYWVARLADPPDPLAFYGEPTRRHTTRVDRLSCPLGAERSRRLLALAADRGGALGGRHAFLCAVFGGVLCAFLRQVTGARRVVFGTYAHNRRSRAFKETLGLFVEVVPVRVDVGDDMTLADLVGSVRRTMLDVLRHAQYAIGNSLHRAAYEVELNYLTISNETHRTLDGATVRATVIPTGHQEETFGIRVLDFENSGTFTLEFHLHHDVFPADRRPLVIQHFLNVLDAFLDDPTRRVDEVSVLSPGERQRVLTRHNRTETAFPLERCFADLWEEQVVRTPDRTAAVGEGRQLTYRELDRQADALACRLREAGIGADHLVAVCLERSLDALVALVAVAKSGGAWIPIDPAYPRERQAGLLADSRASVLVSGRAGLARPTGPGARTIQVDGAGPTGARTLPPVRATGPRHLAYVIYTSGSTGAPKGAMVEQRGMLNHLLAKVRDLGLTEADAVAQTASLAFDISVWQCFAALLVGGRVHVFPDDVAQDPRRLLAGVEADGITVLEVVPSLLRAMIEHLANADTARPALAELRWLIATGEELSPDLCREWLALYPSIPLLNAYGPTEASDDVTHHVVAAPPRALLERVPIGRPIANTRLYVLDRWLQPVPPGVSGELCVGGAGVGRGYLHDPRRTAEAFVPDPHSPGPGARLYRTGDRARLREDGAIEFLGRLDHQVKIRGHRVEPGEIEVALARHPAVRECVVVARPDSREQLRLVAYVVPAGGPATPIELRDFLRASLPDAMIPGVFMTLAALPLTANGKVDRRALPEPDHAAGAPPFVPPRSETERRLAGIWEDVFGVRPIGVTEGFFELGGHSLTAVRVMSRIAAVFGRDLPLATLFTEPTIEALARRLEGQTSGQPWSPLVAIQPHGSRPPLFCIHPGGGSAMDYRHLARHLGPEQPLYGLEARGLDDESEPLTSVDEMARHYLAAVRQARPEGPYALVGHSFGGIVAFAMARQLLADGQEVELVAMIDAWRAPEAGEPTDEDRQWFVNDFAHDLGAPLDHVDLSWDHFWRLTADEQVAYALDVAVKAGVIPAEVGVPRVRRYLRLHVTNVEAMRRHVPTPAPCAIMLLRASDELATRPSDPTLGWAPFATKGVDVVTVPGNHFTILREPNVRFVAEPLRRHLEAVRGEQGSRTGA